MIDMPNIFDYLKWRDLKLEKVEFTEVDNLILSRLAYFPLDNAVEDKEITVKYTDGTTKTYTEHELYETTDYFGLNDITYQQDNPLKVGKNTFGINISCVIIITLSLT